MGLQAGNIAAADAQKLGGLELGQGRLARQAVPQQHQLPLPGGQRLDQEVQTLGVRLLFQVFLHAGGVLQQVGEGQGGIVLAGVEGFLQGDRRAGLFLPPELHPDLICYPLPKRF